jgi:hypothetical protein
MGHEIFKLSNETGTMKLLFEHHYQQKFMEIRLEAEAVIESASAVMELRQQWMSGLTSWHSPYKAIFDCSLLKIRPPAEHEDEVRQSFVRMKKLLEGFFLKKAVCFGISETDGAKLLPFDAFDSRETASANLGIRSARKASGSEDFRDKIQFQNHFRQHVVELSFTDPVKIEDKAQVAVLKSKLTNNLMQWHSSWSLLIDCSHLYVDPELQEQMERMFSFFNGFFMKKVIGYAPQSKDFEYPFTTYRSRHKAAAELEAEGLFSGADADCQSRKKS